MGYRVAVVGATGNVGREMMAILEELNFPVDEMYAVASRRSQGVEVAFGDQTLKCLNLETFDFSKVDIVLMSAGGDVSRAWSEKIGQQGPIVIDNSSAFRMDPDVPLIVPEVNPDAVHLAKKKNIIANPNCSTAQLVVALKPLHDAARIKRAVVATYQSVSGTGKAAMDELWNQTKALYGLGDATPKVYPKQIAFNVLPFAGELKDEGYTSEEEKMWRETHKILDPEIRLTVTCVRVPVFVGRSRSRWTPKTPATCCARPPGSWWSTSPKRSTAGSRRSRRRAILPSSFRAFATTRRSSMASICGWYRTI